MFQDKRSKKIVLVSHCILNQNSISDGTADFPAQFKEIVKLIEEEDIGIIQLPCPEFLCLGLFRKDMNGSIRELLAENTRIRTLLEKKNNLDKLRLLAKPIVCQLREYIEYGFYIVGIIGINRSPSCGVETTSINNNEEEGRGVFMNIILEELDNLGIAIDAIGVKTSNIEESVLKVKQLIHKLDVQESPFVNSIQKCDPWETLS